MVNLDLLTQLTRELRQIRSAQLRIHNQIYALHKHAKDADHAAMLELACGPLLRATEAPLLARRNALEKEIRACGEAMPVWTWVQDVRGVGGLSLGRLIGESGDLSRYSCPSKLWKRMGLAVIDGQRQRRIAGTTKAKKMQAIDHGFSPERRALTYIISENLLKQNKVEYRPLYDVRKAMELEKLGEAKNRKIVAHRRAMRYMVKRFLRDLWCVWNSKPMELEQAA